MKESVLFDKVTNLLNRQGLFEREIDLTDKIVLLLDIKNFKSFNILNGEDKGNLLLKITSNILKNVFNSVITRIGNDEFLIIINKNELKKVKKIKEKLNKENIFFNLSIVKKENNLDKAIEKAYITLSFAKDKHKEILAFNKKLSKEIENQFLAQHLIKYGLEKKAFVYFFQPYVDKYKNIKGVECLIRIQKDNQYYTPFFFIEETRKSRQIENIEKIMIEKIKNRYLFFFKKYSNINFSFNLSPLTLIKPAITKELKTIKTDNLIIEIVERELINKNYIINTIKELSKNFKFAIDDFGTGYSNFLILKNINFQYLKIDIEFTKDIFISIRNQIIIKKLVKLAKALNMKIVVEGIENEEQFSFFKGLDVDYFQGFYFYRPMSMKELENVLQKV